MIEVWLPHTFVHPPTWGSLEGVEVQGLVLDGPDGYLRHFRDRWADRRRFVNVEHDMIVSPAQIDALDVCRSPWCAYPYDGGFDQFPYLGCAKFEPALMEATEHLWDDLLTSAGESVLVGEVPMLRRPPWVPLWADLDKHLAAAAERAGIRCHRHMPPVHNDRPGR